MPVYRTMWWPAHDQANRAWIESLAPLLRRHEAALITMMEQLYQATWPAELKRIDLAAFGPLLGYATPDGRVVLHTTAPENHGLYGLELLLHEL